MSKKEIIEKQIKSSIDQLDTLIARRKELEEKINNKEKECFSILNKAMQNLEEDIFS
jgi:glutaredoxin 2